MDAAKAPEKNLTSKVNYTLSTSSFMLLNASLFLLKKNDKPRPLKSPNHTNGRAKSNCFIVHHSLGFSENPKARRGRGDLR